MIAATVATAKTFYDSTPGSRRVKVFGKLDMVRASTQRFAFILPNGEEGQGILKEGDICDFQGLLAKPIVVFGKAVYRPSGRLLRIDADKIEAGSDADQFFGKIPPGVPVQPTLGKAPVMNGKGGVNVIFVAHSGYPLGMTLATTAHAGLPDPTPFLVVPFRELALAKLLGLLRRPRPRRDFRG